MSHKQEGHKIRNVVIAVGCTATPVQTAASVINTTEFELLFPWSAGFVFFLPSDNFKVRFKKCYVICNLTKKSCLCMFSVKE